MVNNGSDVLGYGICFQSIVPLRREPSDKSELASQLLFGEHYKIISISQDKKWYEIENGYDRYSGWIDFKQHRSVSEEYYKIIDSMDWPRAKDLVGLLHGQNKVFPIIYGSVLPVFNEGVIMFDNEACKYQGEVFYPSTICDFRSIYVIARFFLAAPYLWGGRTPFGIDCSGFTQQVFRICGHKIPRDAWQQQAEGDAVSFAKSKPGDLAFFASSDGKITHVGMICEYNHIIHAHGEVRIDKLDERGIFNEDRDQYTHQLHSIKRYFS
jgi:gamma-D-glutamyl-L-lysine dipeptidyl-peptidase